MKQRRSSSATDGRPVTASVSAVLWVPRTDLKAKLRKRSSQNAFVVRISEARVSNLGTGRSFRGGFPQYLR